MNTQLHRQYETYKSYNYIESNYLRSSNQQHKCLVKDLDHLHAQYQNYWSMTRSLVLLQLLSPERISWLQLRLTATSLFLIGLVKWEAMEWVWWRRKSVVPFITMPNTNSDFSILNLKSKGWLTQSLPSTQPLKIGSRYSKRPSSLPSPIFHIWLCIHGTFYHDSCNKAKQDSYLLKCLIKQTKDSFLLV